MITEAVIFLHLVVASVEIKKRAIWQTPPRSHLLPAFRLWLGKLSVGKSRQSLWRHGSLMRAGSVGWAGFLLIRFIHKPDLTMPLLRVQCESHIHMRLAIIN